MTYESWQSARREMLIALSAWAMAAVWTLGVCWAWGYGRDPQSLKFILGFPDWVFAGIVVPWIVSTIFSVWYSLCVMTDAPLPESPTQDQQTASLSAPQADSAGTALVELSELPR